MTEPTNDRGASLRIDGDWLVDEVGHHTCGTGIDGHYGAHEPGCGLEPLMKVSELAALFDVLTELEVPINRPDELRKHIARIKTEAADELRNLTICQGGEEQHTDHVRYCVPLAEQVEAAVERVTL